MISTNFIHLYQFGCLKQCLTIDVGILLTYLIYSCWSKGLLTSTLAFDIIQFLPLLNHQLLLLIWDKVGFDPRIYFFFSNYLIGRKTQYLWNNFVSPLFNINIGVRQDSALSPILSTLYISPIFHIFNKRAKNSSIFISFLSFVDNGLFISQEKFFVKTNALLFCSYNIISSLFSQFRLIIKH